MTRRQRQVSDRWGSSVVRAPQAAEATAWNVNGRWSGGASAEWAASPAPAYGPPDADSDVRVLRASDFQTGAARANGHEVGVAGEEPGPSPGTPEPAPVAAPYDLDGMRQSIRWVTWAVEECGRAYTRINGRLGDIERRLGALEAAADRPAGHVDAPGSDVDAALEDLASRLAAHRTESARRVDAVEQRLRELDYVPLKVSNLQRQVDRMGSSREAASRDERPTAAAPATTATAAGVTRPAALNASGEPARLRDDLETIRKRVQAVEVRTRGDVLAEAVEKAVRAYLDDHGEELSTASGEVEALYQELDAIAEFVSARAASTAAALERINAPEDSDQRLRALEAGLERLELSIGRVGRGVATTER